MKVNKYLFVFFLSLCFSFALAQTPSYHVNLVNEVFLPPSNVFSWINEKPPQAVEGKYFALIQFYQIPTAAQRNRMEEAGIELGDYIPNYLYEATFNEDFDKNLIRRFGVRAVLAYDDRFKLSPAFYANEIPPHIQQLGYFQMKVIYHPAISHAAALKEIGAHAQILKGNKAEHWLEVTIDEKDLPKLTAAACVRYIEDIAPEPVLERQDWNTVGRSNWLNSGVNGLEYGGEGVTIAVHESGIINSNIHQEFEGRFTEYGSGGISSHKTNVGNRMAGAGNLEPQNASIAWEADLISLNSNSSNNTYFSTLKLRSVNHSFGYGVGTTGWSTGQVWDGDIRDSVGPLHTWSAGNVGGSTSNYGPYSGIVGRANLTGGGKQAKNIFAVGSTNRYDALVNFSSRGPAYDGRIKPDLTIGGEGGTSYAAPKISGIVAQLVEAYKDLNSGDEPHLSMIKAALLNTCDDIENQGIDFTSGFGRANVRRAYETFAGNRHLRDKIINAGSKQHIIAVPANVKQVRILVHWPDYPASSSLPTTALVNNLDMTVTDPSLTVWQPWILDPSPTLTAINSLATRGTDNLNNVEQVTIDNPAAGNYTVNIAGTLIPQGPQAYFLVYEFLYDELTVAYPNGNEHFVPGETEVIKWDSYGATGTFDLDYSEDDGATWTSIATGVAAADRNYAWTVPTTITGQAKVRVTRGVISDVSDEKFSIMAQPTGFQVLWACGGDVMLSWDPLSGATSYRITQLGAKYMDFVATTTNPYYLVSGVSTTNSVFFSLEADGALGARSRRVTAIEKAVGDVNCVGLDVGVVLANFEDGYYPDCLAGGGTALRAQVQNLGTVNASSITVKYRLNGGTIYSESLAGPLAPPVKQWITFSQIPAFASGANELEIWTEMAGDVNINDDTIYVSLVTYAGTSVSTLPYTQDFDSWTSCATSWGCGEISCTAEDGWLNIPNFPASLNDSIDWRTDANGTGSSNTGPSGDHTSGTGKYLYTEGTNSSGFGCADKTALLNSPCIDLSTYADAQLSFWYHMYGEHMGELHLDLLTENGVVSDVMTPVLGEQGNLWIQANVNLTAYIGQTIVLQFRGITGNSFRTDLALDDISITGTSLPANALCQNSTVGLDITGNATVAVSDVDNGSYGIAPLTLSVSVHTFTCSDIGTNHTVTLSAADGGANNDQCTATVTVGGGAASPVPDPIADEETCDDLNYTFPTFTASNSPTTPVFNWNYSFPGLSLSNSGTGQIGTISIPPNTTGGDVVGTVNVTINGISGCPSNNESYTVTVHETPTGITPTTLSVCSGDEISLNLSMQGATPGTYTVQSRTVPSYTFVASTVNTFPATGLAANALLNDRIFNLDPALGTKTVTYNIIPISSSGCEGPATDVDVDVDIMPTSAAGFIQDICSGSLTGMDLAFGLTPAVGLTYNWNIDGVLPASLSYANGTGSGTGNMITDAFTNLTASSVTIRYLFTLSYGSCTSPQYSVFFNVIPTGSGGCRLASARPYLNLGLTGKMANLSDIELTWEAHINNGLSPSHYILEKKKGLGDFSEIGEFDHEEGVNNYQFLDDKGKGMLNAYRVKVVFPNGVSAYSQEVEFRLFNHYDKFIVFPSPAKDFVVLKNTGGDKGTYSYMVTDMHGRQVLTGEISGKQTRIEVKNLPASVYYIKIEAEDGRSYINRFIKE